MKKSTWLGGGDFEGDVDDGLEVTLKDIKLSLIVAFIHTLCEAIFLMLEAKVSKTSYSNYFIVCINGQYGWVPYLEYLTV